jgi:exonuclease 3'-5' domain-containing protein 1
MHDFSDPPHTNIVPARLCQVIFDPRQDSDAIYAQQRIYLRNVVCLQLSDVASDRSEGAYTSHVNGLARVLGTCLPYGQRQHAQKVKAIGKRMFAPAEGGSYEVFRERPLDRRMIEYMCMDIIHFEYLYKKLFLSLPSKWEAWVLKHSAQRVDECKKATASTQGRHRAIAPR